MPENDNLRFSVRPGFRAHGSNWATVRSATSNLTDIDEASLGYVLTKYVATPASSAGGKAYLLFDLSGTNAPSTNSNVTLSVVRYSTGGTQRIQLWALNQAFTAPTNFTNINWNNAPANDIASNAMLTNGTTNATLILETQSPGGIGTNNFTIPAPWGQFVKNKKMVLVFTGTAAVAPDTNSSAGYRISLAVPPTLTMVVGGSVLPTIGTNGMFYMSPGFFPGTYNFSVQGAPGQSYTVWSSANPALPMAQWTQETDQATGSQEMYETIYPGELSAYSFTVQPPPGHIVYRVRTP